MDKYLARMKLVNKFTMRRLAILPARGGSKRIPNKNIRDFCGQPMISHILNTAESSNLFDKIHVSTDSKTVLDVVSDLGFIPDFIRPNNLSGDNIPIMPVLKFVVSEYKRLGFIFDQVWLLFPCSPLITSTDLIQAEKLFINSGKTRPVLSISEYPVPVEWAFKLDQDLNLNPIQPGKFAIRSQDLAPHYYDSGSFSIYPYAFISECLESGTDIGSIGFVLPRNKGIDIDTFEDWDFAESLFLSKSTDR
tara:strand:- start:94 stop:840 length:747 start_codon:yes stop_codon:yes gene_type:complete